MDSRYSLSPQELRDIVFEYLIANCYPETAKALIHDETARGERMGQIAKTQKIEGLKSSKSAEEKEKQAKEMLAIQAARKRKEIQDAVLWGDISTARKQVESNFPTVLPPSNDKVSPLSLKGVPQGSKFVIPQPRAPPQCYGWTYPHQDLLVPTNLGIEMQIQDFLETSRTIRVPHPGYRLAQWRRTGQFDPAPRQLDNRQHDEDTEDSSSAASSQDDMGPSTPSSPLYTSRAALDVKPEFTGGGLIGSQAHRLSDPNSLRHHLLLSKTQLLIVAINGLESHSPDAHRDYMEELGDVTGILAYERPEIALKNRRPIRHLDPAAGRKKDGLDDGEYRSGKGMGGRGRYGSPLGRTRPQEGSLTTDARIHDWLGIHRRISLAQSINEAILYRTGHSPVPFLSLIASQTTVVFECLQLGGCRLPNRDERRQLKLQPLSHEDIVERDRERQRQRERTRKAWSLGQIGQKSKEGWENVDGEVRNQKGWIDMMVGWVGVSDPSSTSSSHGGDGAKGKTGVDWGEYDDDAADSDEMYDNDLEYPETNYASSDEDEDDKEESEESGSDTDDLSIYTLDITTWLDASERRDKKERRKRKREMTKSGKMGATNHKKPSSRLMGRSVPTSSVRIGSRVFLGPSARVGEVMSSDDSST